MSNNWKKTIKFAKTVTSNNQIRQYGTVRKGQIYHFRIHRLCHSLDPIYRNADCCQQIQSGYFCKADCLCMQQPFRLAALLLLLDSHLRRIRNLQNQVRQEKDACHRDHNSSGRAVPRSAWAYNTVINTDRWRSDPENKTGRDCHCLGASREEPCQLWGQAEAGRGGAYPHGHGIHPFRHAPHCRPRDREPYLWRGQQLDTPSQLQAQADKGTANQGCFKHSAPPFRVEYLRAFHVQEILHGDTVPVSSAPFSHGSSPIRTWRPSKTSR